MGGASTTDTRFGKGLLGARNISSGRAFEAPEGQDPKMGTDPNQEVETMLPQPAVNPAPCPLRPGTVASGWSETRGPKDRL